MTNNIENHAKNAPCAAPAVFWGMVALLGVLALLGAFLTVWAACLWLPLWTVWAAAAVALAVCFWIGFTTTQE